MRALDDGCSGPGHRRRDEHERTVCSRDHFAQLLRSPYRSRQTAETRPFAFNEPRIRRETTEFTERKEFAEETEYPRQISPRGGLNALTIHRSHMSYRTYASPASSKIFDLSISPAAQLNRRASFIRCSRTAVAR